jgi:ABC-type amino acid transport substrate-binding protein
MTRIALVLLGCLAVVPASAEPALRICLQSNDPPLSSRRGGEAGGFDVALARLVAQRLGRPLEMQWFVTRADPDSNPVTEANALLSDQRCELVADYPLVADKLGRPRAATGRLPPFEGATPEDRRRWISLGTLVPTRPYRFDAVTVALSPDHAARIVHSLGDLVGLRIGVEIHGLPDLMAMTYREGELAEHVVHFSWSRTLFGQLEAGSIDAALIETRALDAWCLAHPATGIAATGYTHSIGFNIGFVGLPAGGALIEQVNAILAELLADGSLKNAAQTASMTYLPPRPPDISSGLSFGALSGD